MKIKTTTLLAIILICLSSCSITPEYADSDEVLYYVAKSVNDAHSIIDIDDDVYWIWTETYDGYSHEFQESESSCIDYIMQHCETYSYYPDKIDLYLKCLNLYNTDRDLFDNVYDSFHPRQKHYISIIKYGSETVNNEISSWLENIETNKSSSSDWHFLSQEARNFIYQTFINHNKFDGQDPYNWIKEHLMEVVSIEIVNTELNEQELGDTYTGFFITYHITSVLSNKYNYYALVDLIEFDNGRYEAGIITIDEDLSSVQSYLY